MSERCSADFRMANHDTDRAFLHECYDLLRSVEKYGDWDSEYYSRACDLKERLGEYLWPDAEAPPDD